MQVKNSLHRRFTTLVTLLALSALSCVPALADRDAYTVSNLVSNVPGVAAVTDPNLVNPWGIAYSPTGPFWISDNGSGLSTLYNDKGAIIPLVVTIPGVPAGATGSPTGQVFNGSSDFAVGTGAAAGPAFFIFDSEDGTISGWKRGRLGDHRGRPVIDWRGLQGSCPGA